MILGAWRRQLRLRYALERLAAGGAVTATAYDGELLGPDHPETEEYRAKLAQALFR